MRLKLVNYAEGKYISIASAFADGNYPYDLGYVGEPNEKFVWNKYLTDPAERFVA